MIIEAIVKKGINKEKCDDSVLINSQILNEDALVVECEVDKICVADGVGGNEGGMEASLFVLNTIGIDSFVDYCKSDFENYFLELNKKLNKYSSILDGKSNMATTFTGILKGKDGYYLCHIGNTRFYVKQGHFLRQETTDHTQFQKLIELGLYKEAEDVNKSIITGCFGGGSETYIKSISITNLFENITPAMMLLTSDGIHDYLEIDDIENALENYEGMKTLNLLVSKAEMAGSYDDKSIVIIRR